MGLDSVELVLAVEEEFDLKLPDAQVAVILTPRDFSDVVEVILKQEQRSMSRSKIDACMKSIILEQLAVEATEYCEDKEFVRDFGMS